MKVRQHGNGDSRGDVGTVKNLEEGHKKEKNGLKFKGVE